MKPACLLDFPPAAHQPFLLNFYLQKPYFSSAGSVESCLGFKVRNAVVPVVDCAALFLPSPYQLYSVNGQKKPHALQKILRSCKISNESCKSKKNLEPLCCRWSHMDPWTGQAEQVPPWAAWGGLQLQTLVHTKVTMSGRGCNEAVSFAN